MVIIIILLIIVAIGVVWTIANNLINNYTKFKITDNICHNETIYCHGELCSYEINGIDPFTIRYELPINQGPSANYNILEYEGKSYLPVGCHKYEKECGLMEVCEDIEDYGIWWNSGCGEDGCASTFIKEDDLTIDWLDRNTHCDKHHCRDGYSAMIDGYCYKDFDLGQSYPAPCAIYSYDNGIENYKIEVLR